MPIVSDDGVYENELQQVAAQYGLEAPTEAAGALKSSGGTQTPENNPETNFFNRLSIVKPIQGMLKGPNLEEDKAVLKGLWESIKSGFTLPGDVSQGKIDVGSVQTVERALDLAGLAVLGPAPVAAKMADGSLGSFMGVKSQSIDKTKLYKAQNMELQGAHPDDIWKETGTFRGADGRWRQEISDLNMKLKEDAFDIQRTPAQKGTETGWGEVGGKEAEEIWALKYKELYPPDNATPAQMKEYLQSFDKPEFAKLSDVVDHPELFKAYPELNNFTVTALPQKLIDQGIKGQVSGNTIYLAPGHPEYLKSVMVHEIQHGVQRIEGFARGGNSGEFKTPQLAKAQKQFESVKEATVKDILESGHFSKDFIDQAIGKMKFAEMFEKGDPTHALWDAEVSKIRWQFMQKGRLKDFERLKDIAEGQRLIDNEELKQLELYRRLSGEVEARNVQTRMNMRDEARREQSPRSTEDRPRFVQRNVGQNEQIQHK